MQLPTHAEIKVKGSPSLIIVNSQLLSESHIAQ